MRCQGLQPAQASSASPAGPVLTHTRTGVEGGKGDAGGLVQALVHLAHGQHVAHLRVGTGQDRASSRRAGGRADERALLCARQRRKLWPTPVFLALLQQAAGVPTLESL